mmetsp:Transcript_83038/g.165785  ORF Transcript_83038/g.165785 Transcript_83038/m.165785 type:complete len:106 (-) Transcript_83038:324-641(-)
MHYVWAQMSKFPMCYGRPSVGLRHVGASLQLHAVRHGPRSSAAWLSADEWLGLRMVDRICLLVITAQCGSFLFTCINLGLSVALSAIRSALSIHGFALSTLDEPR